MSWPDCLLPARLTPGKRVEVSHTALSGYYLQLRNLRGKSYVLLISLYTILKKSLVSQSGTCAQPWANYYGLEDGDDMMGQAGWLLWFAVPPEQPEMREEHSWEKWVLLPEGEQRCWADTYVHSGFSVLITKPDPGRETTQYRICFIIFRSWLSRPNHMKSY